MCEDEEGFLYPKLDSSKCINCGLCVKICPISSNNGNNDEYSEQHSYLMTSNAEENYFRSATAGVCTVLAKMVLAQGGIVFGVELDEKEWRANHIAVCNSSGIEKIRNSKYLQSDTKRTFTEARDALKKGKQVLYIGTPCQIAGLKSFLRKDYENLLTIDLVCHGVYSYKLIREEVKHWEKFYNGKISDFRFRSKTKYPHAKGGIINFDIKRWYGKKHYEILGPFSPTYRCYAYSGDGKNYNLRYSCYSCHFRNSKRYGDFTIGDPWFITRRYPSIHTPEHIKHGISLVICNTPKANGLYKYLSSVFVTEEIESQDAFSQPALNKCNREIPDERNFIYKNLSKKQYCDIINETLHINITHLYKDSLKLEKEQYIKDFIKKMLFINKFRSIFYQLNLLKIGFDQWYINNIISMFPSKRVRYWYLKHKGMQLANNVRFYAGFHIRNPKGIRIEEGVSIGPKVLLDGRKGLTIGKNSVIAYDAIIWSLNHDYNDIHFCGKGAPVEIGAYTWICSRSIILPGIKIGEGAVVASGAIVTKDVEPYSIVAGIPAKKIGERQKRNYEYGYNKINDNNHCW